MARAALRTWVGSGGLAPAGARWLPCRPHFFLPVKVLSQRFRRLFLMALEHVYSRGELPRFGCFGRLYHGFPLNERILLANSKVPNIVPHIGRH